MSMVNLGLAYINGRGILQDYAKGLEWITKAADAGHPLGYMNLGLLHEEGFGVKRDLEKARGYYQKALDLGFPPAAERLKKLKK